MLYVGKVNLYLEALDREVKKENENLSVGIIWCASKDDEVVEFALSRRLSPKIKKKKTVIVYGISKATSNKLKTFANKCIELPTTEQERRIHYDMILRNMDYIVAHNKIIHATFTSTVKAVCLRNQVDEDKIKAALRELIDMGIIVKQAITIGVSGEINILRTNWDLAVKKGLWNYNNA